jgi:hypothetical protein
MTANLLNHWRYGAAQALEGIPERDFFLTCMDEIIGIHPDPTGGLANETAAWLLEDLKDVVVDATGYATISYVVDPSFHGLNIAYVAQAPARLAEDVHLLNGLDRAIGKCKIGNDPIKHFALVQLVRAARRFQYINPGKPVIPLYPAAELMEGAA